MNPFLQARLSAFTLMTMLLGFCLTISAQVDQEAKTAEALKPNVIGIKSTFANGSQARGFGIIAGESQGRLFIATSSALSKEASSNKQATKIQVRTINDIRWLEATFVYSWDSDNLSLLEIKKPEWLKWVPECLSSQPAALQKVRFVGKQTEEPGWVYPGSGEIYEVVGNKINFEISTLTPGSIGAPLVNEHGIVGIITKDNSTLSSALSINRVKELLVGNGQYPYFSMLPYKNASVNPVTNSSLATTNNPPNSAAKPNPLPENPEPETVQQPKLRYTSDFFGDRYEIGDKDANSRQISSKLLTISPEAHKIYRSGEKLSGASGWFTLIGLGCLVWYWVDPYTGYYDDTFNTPAVAGAAFGYSMDLILSSSAKHKKRKAIDLYNRQQGY